MRRHPLLQFAGIPITAADIRSCYPDLKHPDKKVLALEQSGEIIRLKRGLYIVNRELSGSTVDPRLCANHLYGPSYVSLQWALRYYGMIPERVYLMTSVTTKSSRTFDTPIGSFGYMRVPASYFPIGVGCEDAEGVCFMMASREKALCDTIMYDKYVPHKSVKSLHTYLEEDMRLDMDQLAELDTEVIGQCAQSGCKSNILYNLIKIIQS